MATPINETVITPEEKRMADIKLAISFAIVFGIGLISGWYLTASGFFG
jgi:hypothetical protein